jgi:radical SAM superfamily enzyme
MSEKRLQPTILLAADRTLAARYRVLFEGIFATMQTTQVPEMAMRHFVAPAVKTDIHGRAHTAPLGLRRIEASLIDTLQLQPDDVVCTSPDKIESLIGPWTKIVAVSSSDPMGMGMSNTTTTNFWTGELYTRKWTRQLLEKLGQLKEKYKFTVVGGGAGAWQWLRYQDKTANDVLDSIFEGYFETLGPTLFRDILDGKSISNHIRCEQTCAAGIRPIRNASLMGIVELSRGCGRGCSFCTMADKKMEHLPADTILSDLQTNVTAGVRSIVSGSEDFFRYGAAGIKPEFEKLHTLLEQMRQVRGLSFMQLDHANVSTVAQLTDAQLLETRRLLTWEKPTEYLWINMGAESASGRLVAANCPGKVAPFRAEDWEEMLYTTARRMTQNGYFGVFSLVLGLPGETPEDVEKTLRFVRFLETQNAVVFPVFYEPLVEQQIQAGYKFTLNKMTTLHLDLYRSCYEINFRQIPKLFWDNQRAGGVSWFKRTAMQMLGKTEVYSWRKTFRKLDAQLAKTASAGEAVCVG